MWQSQLGQHMGSHRMGTQPAHMKAWRGVTTLAATCCLAFASSSSSSSTAPYAAASATVDILCRSRVSSAHAALVTDSRIKQHASAGHPGGRHTPRW